MESRTFIRQANVLIADIQTFANANLSHEEEMARGTALQKEIQSVFTGLGNPTLVAAEKLLDVAVGAGFVVSPQMQQRIRQAQAVWNQIP